MSAPYPKLDGVEGFGADKVGSERRRRDGPFAAPCPGTQLDVGCRGVPLRMTNLLRRLRRPRRLLPADLRAILTLHETQSEKVFHTSTSAVAWRRDHMLRHEPKAGKNSVCLF